MFLFYFENLAKKTEMEREAVFEKEMENMSRTRH